MQNISETLGHNCTVSASPHESLRDRAIDQLKDITRRFNDDNGPADHVVDDFMRNFDSTELLGPGLGDLSDEKKEKFLSAAARCHVASFGWGREFLAKRNHLHLADEDCATLFGALPAESRAAMIAGAYVGDRGQIVFPFPDIGLCIPLGRTSLGTGEGALTTHEMQKLLTDPEARLHCLLDIFSAKLVQFDAQSPDTETCHVWTDLIDQCIDRKPIAEFSGEKAVLEALAFTLRNLTDRAFLRGCEEAFPIVRMHTHCAEAYFLAGDLGACGATLCKLAASHALKFERDAAVGVATLAASVFARNALKRWEDGHHADAVVCHGMALRTYAEEFALRRLRGEPRAPISGAVDEIVPLPKFVEHISKSDFEGAWAAQRAKIEETLSDIESNLRTLAIMGRLAKLRAQKSNR